MDVNQGGVSRFLSRAIADEFDRIKPGLLGIMLCLADKLPPQVEDPPIPRILFRTEAVGALQVSLTISPQASPLSLYSLLRTHAILCMFGETAYIEGPSEISSRNQLLRGVRDTAFLGRVLIPAYALFSLFFFSLYFSYTFPASSGGRRRDR